MKKKTNKSRYNFLIDKDVYSDFSLICEELGLIRSKQVENLLKEFLEKRQDILKKLKK